MEKLLQKVQKAIGATNMELVMEYDHKVLWTAVMNDRHALVTFDKRDGWVLSKGEGQRFWDVEVQLNGGH